ALREARRGRRARRVPGEPGGELHHRTSHRRRWRVPMNDTTWDVIVVGAGPAGSATAGLLAGAGHGVLVLEREAFPRFHIGESLLPLSLPVLDRLGVGADDNFLYKQGAEFVRETTGDQRMFDFAEALPGPPRHAWQVVRAGFDTRLRDRAIALGATVRDA